MRVIHTLADYLFLLMQLLISRTLFQQWDGEFTEIGGSTGQDYTLINKVDKGYHEGGTSLTVRMMGKYSGTGDPSATAEWCDLTYDDQTVPPVKVPDSKL